MSIYEYGEHSVDPAILDVATGMELPSTAHIPDVAEEVQIASASFSLASIGVQSPILLSQYDSAYGLPTQRML